MSGWECHCVLVAWTEDWWHNWWHDWWGGKPAFTCLPLTTSAHCPYHHGCHWHIIMFQRSTAFSVENAQLLTNKFIQVLLVLFIISIIIYQLAVRRSNAMQWAMIIASFNQLIAIHLKQNQLTSATDFFPHAIHWVVDMPDHPYYLKRLRSYQIRGPHLS